MVINKTRRCTLNTVHNFLLYFILMLYNCTKYCLLTVKLPLEKILLINKIILDFLHLYNCIKPQSRLFLQILHSWFVRLYWFLNSLLGSICLWFLLLNFKTRNGIQRQNEHYLTLIITVKYIF